MLIVIGILIYLLIGLVCHHFIVRAVDDDVHLDPNEKALLNSIFIRALTAIIWPYLLIDNMFKV